MQRNNRIFPGSWRLPAAAVSHYISRMTDDSYIIKPDPFDKRLTELSKLAGDAQKATSSDTFKPSFMAIGGACKSCHDNYRKKST